MERPSSIADVDRRRLEFQVAEQRYQIEASQVLEVIRATQFTRVPRGPPALVGIVNRRGQPVPVLSMATILGNGTETRGEHSKIIVYDHGGPVGLLVDDVLQLSAVGADALLEGLDERLDSVFKFARSAPSQSVIGSSQDVVEKADTKLVALLSFQIAGQLYGFPLGDVREVTKFTGEGVSPSSANLGMVGLITMRDAVLPLISLAFLLGLDTDGPTAQTAHIVIIEHENDLVGLIVDEMHVIRRLPEQAIDAVPTVLQRSRGDAQIEAIGRPQDDGRLISILSPKKLFGHQAVTQAINGNAGAKPMSTTAHKADALEQFLIFQLGDETYGLPIASVDEVIQIPHEVTRMPGAPDFVMGVINLRGTAVALIDQRRRFDSSISDRSAKVRAIVVTLGKFQAGFVVDSISEVKAISASALSQAPIFSSDETSVFDRVAHIEADGRMILLIDPQELLSRAEQDVVTALTRDPTSLVDP